VRSGSEMAKVKMPLFSAGARGTLGDGITYKGGLGGPLVTRKPVRVRGDSEAQQAQRQRFQDGALMWKAVDAEERAEYEALGRLERMTGYNYFIRLTMRERSGE